MLTEKDRLIEVWCTVHSPVDNGERAVRLRKLFLNEHYCGRIGDRHALL